MSLNTIQQIFETVNSAKKILITFNSGAGGDAVGASLSLAKLFKKMDKESDIISVNWCGKQYQFLPTSDQIKTQAAGLQKFIIHLDTAKTKVKELEYEVKNERTLEIKITPQSGFFTLKDVKTATAGFAYDLVIVLDTPDLESLGELYEHNTEFFYQVPIINIDHQPQNEHFGHINYVELAACSVCEMIYEIINHLGGTLDNETATWLLTGIIAKTKNFRAPKITPKCLQRVSELIANGAEREIIMRNLYWSRSTATIQLWGRALAKLKHEPTAHAVISYLSHHDFKETGTEEEDLNDVIDELISCSPEAQIIILLMETQKENQPFIKALVSVHHHYNALEICKSFEPAGNRQLAICEFANHTAQEVEDKILAAAKKTGQTLGSETVA